MKFKELEQQYKEKQDEEKAQIKAEPSKWKRFWKWAWYLFVFPFKWIWVNIRDWRTVLIFILVVAAVSCEVWIPYLFGFMFNNNWLIGIGSACWSFWLLPGTPFLVICIGLTMAIKALFNRIATWRTNRCQKKLKKQKNKNNQQ